MGFDHAADFGHEADGFVEGDDDALVVGNVVVLELLLTIVLQKFLGLAFYSALKFSATFFDVCRKQ